MKSITESLLLAAKQGRFPVTLRDQNTTTVFLPSGHFMTVSEAPKCRPRNNSMFVHPDAIRQPGMLLRRTNETCDVWFAWFDDALHGQFASEQEATAAMMA